MKMQYISVQVFPLPENVTTIQLVIEYVFQLLIFSY